MNNETSASVRVTESFGTAPVGRLIARFAAPSVVAMVTMSLYNIVDQLFIGHGVGYLGNAATNIIFPVNILAIAVSMLIGEGACALFSIKLGENDREGARKCIGNAVALLTVVSVAFATLCLLCLQPVLGFFGATEAVMPYAVDYAGPIVFGIPFLVIGPGLNAFIRARGYPGFAMKAMLVGAVLNTILDPIFIFTFDMGVGGAAVATAIAQFVSFSVSVLFFVRGNIFGLARSHFRIGWTTTRRILATGTPPCLSQMAIMVVIIVVNRALVLHGADSRFGAEIPLAAHGIAMKVNQILLSVMLGISMGAQPIIGYNFGAGNYRRVKRAFILSVAAATAAGFVGFVMFVFFPQTVISMFGAEEELYNEFARRCFRIFLFCIGLNGFTVLSGVFFQSMARIGRAATIQLSRQIVFMIPAVHVLSGHYGLEGVLLAGPVTDSLSFLLALALVLAEMRALTAKQNAVEAVSASRNRSADPVGTEMLGIAEPAHAASASARLA